jgi:hypothetical protein
MLCFCSFVYKEVFLNKEMPQKVAWLPLLIIDLRSLNKLPLQMVN